MQIRHLIALAAPAIFLVSLLAAAYLTPLDLRFGTNDDAAMSNILAGQVNGVQPGEPRLIYISAFIGAVLAALHDWQPAVDWYSLLQLVLCFASLVVLSWYWLSRHSRLISLICYGVFLLLFMFPVFAHLQFTKTSYMLVLLGALLLVAGLERARTALLVMSVAAFSGAFLMRNASIGFSCLVIAALAGYWILFRASTHGSWRRDLLRCLAVVIALLLLHAGHGAAEKGVFYSSPEWQSFREANALRARVQHNYPSVAARDEVLATLERNAPRTWAEYQLVLGWLMVAPDYYSAEWFRDIAAHYAALPGSWRQRLASGLDATETFLDRTRGFEALLICVFLLTLLQQLNARGFALALYWCGVTLAAIATMTVLFRTPPYYVWLPTVAVLAGIAATLAATAVPAGTAAEGAPGTSSTRGYFANPDWLTCFALFLLAVKFNTVNHYQVVELRDAFDQRCRVTDSRIERMQSLGSGSHFYIAGAIINSTCFTQPFRNAIPRVVSEQTTIFGWMNLTPWMRERVFPAGRASLLPQLCEQPDRYLLAGRRNVDRLRRYIDVLGLPYELQHLDDEFAWEDAVSDFFWVCSRSSPAG